LLQLNVRDNKKGRKKTGLSIINEFFS